MLSKTILVCYDKALAESSFKLFAPRNLVDTFLIGFSSDVLSRAAEHAEKSGARKKTIRTSLKMGTIPNLET